MALSRTRGGGTGTRRRRRSAGRRQVPRGDEPALALGFGRALSLIRRFVGLPGLIVLLLWGSQSPRLANPPVALDLAPMWAWLRGRDDELVVGLLLLLVALALLLRQGRVALTALVLAWLAFSPERPPLGVALVPVLLTAIAALPPRHPWRRRNLTALVGLLTAGWVVQTTWARRVEGQIGEHLAPIEAWNSWGFSIAAALVLVFLTRRPSPLLRAALWSLPVLAAGLGEVVVASVPSRLSLAAVALVWILGTLGEAHALSFRDPLTGLPGRRALDRELAELGRRFAVAMVDVDHFKRVNDRHGHDVGDQVLAKVAAHLARVRGGRSFRYGGEEFVIVFRGRHVKACEPRLERLRERIADSPFGVRGTKRRLSVTVSIGLARSGPALSSSHEVLAAADQALYRAKRNGRNRLSEARSG